MAGGPFCMRIPVGATNNAEALVGTMFHRSHGRELGTDGGGAAAAAVAAAGRTKSQPRRRQVTLTLAESVDILEKHGMGTNMEEIIRQASELQTRQKVGGKSRKPKKVGGVVTTTPLANLAREGRPRRKPKPKEPAPLPEGDGEEDDSDDSEVAGRPDVPEDVYEEDEGGGGGSDYSE